MSRPRPSFYRRDDGRSAFTLVELMFTVIILGLGLTMIAALLLAATGQTRSNVDEGSAAAIARTAVATLEQLLTGDSVPTTGGVVQPLSGPLRQRVYGNLISPTDPRYAWVPLYRRDGTSPFAQVYVFVLRNRNRTLYEPGIDLRTDPDDISGSGATLDPAGVIVSLVNAPPGEADRIRFEPDLSNTPARISPGAFVLIANAPGDANGRILRVGNLMDAATNTWELSPGFDLQNDAQNLDAATAYVIGKGYADPTRPSNGYDGPAQDIAIFTAFVRLK